MRPKKWQKEKEKTEASAAEGILGFGVIEKIKKKDASKVIYKRTADRQAWNLTQIWGTFV